MRRDRGLAGTDLQVLAATCLDPATRTLRRLGAADAKRRSPCSAAGAPLGHRTAELACPLWVGSAH